MEGWGRIVGKMFTSSNS